MKPFIQKRTKPNEDLIVTAHVLTYFNHLPKMLLSLVSFHLSCCKFKLWSRSH